MTRRKDNKNRVLKTGESQRRDGRYQYRFTNSLGKRECVYANTLEELRVKEAEINKSSVLGLKYGNGKITVLEFLKKYISLKNGVRQNTKIGYNFVRNLVAKEEFGSREIGSIKKSDAMEWFAKLASDGRSYNTIMSVRGIIKPAFQMAVDEDVIRHNPFNFVVTDVVKNDERKRRALTPEQAHSFMEFVKQDNYHKKHFDQYMVLLLTGMRISELCGLTIGDIDFEQKMLRINKQLLRDEHSNLRVETTKTPNGVRFIPIDDELEVHLKKLVEKRPPLDVEPIVDGHSGFLVLDAKKQPIVAMHIEHHMQRTLAKYNEAHDEKLSVTPHVLRHTFCTMLANKQLDLKSLQYLMGHSDASTTLNIYTHASYEHTKEQLAKLKSQNNGLLNLPVKDRK